MGVEGAGREGTPAGEAAENPPVDVLVEWSRETVLQQAMKRAYLDRFDLTLRFVALKMAGRAQPHKANFSGIGDFSWKPSGSCEL